jgi:hypothetical protein
MGTIAESLLQITSDEQAPIPTDILYGIVDSCTDAADEKCIEVR